MDVLTIMWGWIGGKKAGSAPPVIPTTRASIRISDNSLYQVPVDSDFTNSMSIFDDAIYSVTVRDE